MREREEIVEDIFRVLYRLEKRMSALTDQVDQALGVLSNDSTNFGAALAAGQAAQAVIQGQLDAANAGQAADAAELQKALDALQASHAALQSNQASQPVAAPAPAPVADPGTQPVAATPAPAPADAIVPPATA